MTDTIWSRLAAPIDSSRVAWRQDGKAIKKGDRFYARFVPYVEANTVRARLDEVCPGWNSELVALMPAGDSDGTPFQSFKCCLSLRLVDTDAPITVTREDVGQGSDYKSAATDAFKRAAVRFGIGSELYDMEVLWVEVDGDGKYAKPLEEPGVAYAKLLKKNGSGEQRANPPRTSASAAAPSRAPVAPSASPPPPSGDVPCPRCGGPTWDNRTKKTNPRAPDYKCKNRECDGAVWPPKDSGRVASIVTAAYEDGAFGNDDDPSLPF